MKNTLDLALIGNCQVGALIDSAAEIVWYSHPIFDCALALAMVIAT